VRRLPARAGLPVILIVFAVVAACTTQPVLLPSRDFDRPTDVTFVCLGTSDPSASASSADGGTDASDASEADAGGGPVVSGQPMRNCHPRGKVEKANANLRTFAFLPNSSNGELSVVDADTWKLVNLDPANPGFNRLPLGVLPSQITASDDGCRLVTANHGSCDLSVVDPAALLAPTLAKDHPGLTTGSATSQIVRSVVPMTKSGEKLHVFAGEVAFLPMATDMTGGPSLCPTDPNHDWQALVTFPSCDLVALIDLPSGEIQKAAYVRSKTTGGVRQVALVPLADGEDPVCPVVDCGYSPDAGTDAEAGTLDAGAAGQGASAAATVPVPPYLGPGPIAIIPETGRAYVGLANAPYVLAFNVDQDQLSVDATGGSVFLAENALGVNRIRLSIDPYKDKTTGTVGKSGAFIGDDPDTTPTSRPYLRDRQYLYVIARDGTLRVVQVAHPPETECETNRDFGAIDPTVPHSTVRQQAMNDACPAIDPAKPRRPGAIGPGIRLPAPPIDVAVADIRPTPDDRSETSVSGAHAWILTANGSVYLVNIDPVTRRIFWVEKGTNVDDPAIVQTCTTPTGDCHDEEEPPPNTLRNRNFVGYTLALDPSAGPPRLDVPPSQATIGPRLESIWTQGTAANATALSTNFIKTNVFFPDPAAVTPQSWGVTWEGPLMPGPRQSGQLDATSRTLEDLGMDFCRLGVIPNDLVTLTGCTQTSQCGLGKTCVPGSNGALGAGGLPITGLCLSSTSTTARPKNCNDLLSTVKRYDVASTRQDALALVPHKDELVRPDLKPCILVDAATADGGTDGGTDANAADAAAAAPDATAPTGGDAADARASTGDSGADSALARLRAQKDNCVDPEDPTTSGFHCIERTSGSGAPVKRCLYPCTHLGKTEDCRSGRICVSFGSKPPLPTPQASPDGGTGSDPCDTLDCFCADGPDLATPESQSVLNECLGELFPYQVSVGRGFLVSGSQSAIPVTMMADPKGLCVPLPDPDQRDAIRIPMNAIECTNPVVDLRDNALDSRCDPNDLNSHCALPKVTANQLRTNATTTGQPNPCLFAGGPNETDPSNQQPDHVHALFRNREVQFMMTNLERPPSGAYQIRFDVHGGFQPQSVAIPSTVEVTMPARIVLGPFDSNPQTDTSSTGEVPYLFVVDQRRLGRSQGGGPTRGQLLRIHPRGFPVSSPVAGAQPWYEDLSHSANLFPIQ
jgi:hypothetical protein